MVIEKENKMVNEKRGRPAKNITFKKVAIWFDIKDYDKIKTITSKPLGTTISNIIRTAIKEWLEKNKHL